MRTTMDFSPLFRSSVGFDRVLNLLENASRIEPIDNWPPYDIVKTGDDTYRICMAVAGYTQEDLTITHEPNMLVVTAQKADDGEAEYLHRGIAARAFQRRFELADHVKVSDASLVNGLLTIDLVREVPESMKPKRIPVQTGTGLAGPQSEQIEHKQAA